MIVYAWCKGVFEWKRKHGEPLIQFALLEDVLNLARANSLWPMTFGLACCAIEMMAAGMPASIWTALGPGFSGLRPASRDLMIVAGTISKKMAPAVKRLYDQMPAPKWVHRHGQLRHFRRPLLLSTASMPSCPGADLIIPVDVYIPGCPPRPEGLIEGILQLEEKITNRGRLKEV